MPNFKGNKLFLFFNDKPKLKKQKNQSKKKEKLRKHFGAQIFDRSIHKSKQVMLAPLTIMASV